CENRAAALYRCVVPDSKPKGALAMAVTMTQLNGAAPSDFVRLLDGTYEHSPWIAERAFAKRPTGGFASLAQLKLALVEVVREAGRDAQLALIRAHPELGSGATPKPLTVESSGEQRKAGLLDCTAEELERIRALNADYRVKFGFPFVVAV